MVPLAPSLGAFATVVLFALFVFLPIGAYIWLRYRGTLGEPPGRGLQ